MPDIQSTNRFSTLDDGVSGIYKQNDWGDISSTSLAECVVETSGGYIINSDIHFNYANFTFATTDTFPGWQFDLESVALHEMGHFLGLSHSENPEDVMYPSIASGIKKRSLSSGDIEAVLLKY